MIQLAKSIKEKAKKEAKEAKPDKKNDKDQNEETTTEVADDDEDEYNISLASLEIELKPKILKTLLIFLKIIKINCVSKRKSRIDTKRRKI